MVNMVGFHHKEPVYFVPGPGEDGFYFKIRATPSHAFPDRARVTYPSGYATFNDRYHASRFANHPGAVPHAARAYLDWLDDKEANA